MTQTEANPPADAQGAESPPDTSEYGIDTAFDTVLAIWHDFLAHLPLLGAGVVALFATWIVAMLVDLVAKRLLGRTRLRGSLQSLLERIL